MSAVLDRLRADPRVQFVDDERSLGNSVIVTLHYGWRFDDPGTHVFGEDTPTAALASLKSCKPCGCAECAAVVTTPAGTAKPGATMKKRKTIKTTNRRDRRQAAANLRKAKASKRRPPAPRGKRSTRKAAAAKARPLASARRTKADELADFLRVEGGRSIAAVCAEFGWLKHSARAAISRLGTDKGEKVDTTKGDNGTVYAIKAAA